MVHAIEANGLATENKKWKEK